MDNLLLCISYSGKEMTDKGMQFQEKVRPRWSSVSSRLWGRRVRGSKPDSTEDPPCMGPIARQIISTGQTSSRWHGVEVWRGVCHLRRHPRHLTVVQDDEIRPKIALALLQNGMLI
ncbi:hypothetical protein AVEN_192485-1 [Araneus ventricosus]|uniref:Uncharacterized protein n=1 Tax=Araneus ventricosus TaxID=182803 RepID=A0A4Y2U744_ARAVE|nr:hypothetical protein AVEN_19891-1 [Araneus ventricosus]GBO08402.1 hypothetical protein AVEN_20421-1 [Araneus ventricosus]GBO08452.1 hypothetical protein AVEN_192485-1 [Araneus ventricosus]